MEYQKLANLLSSELNQPSKFRTKNWVEINNDARGEYFPDKQTRFRTSMLRSYILLKGNIKVINTAADGTAAANNTNKKIIFQNCVPFTSCINKINNKQTDNAQYCDNYSRTSGSLVQNCKEIPAVNNNGAIVAFDGTNTTDSFNFKTKITC